jgi:cell division inhibitor SepF
MVTASDAYDDWYEDDEPYGDAGESWRETPASRRLGLVRRPELGFDLVTPGDFEDAQIVADRFKAGTPVLIDLQGLDPDLAGRLTDFAAGLVYALGGSVQPVGCDLLLVAPGHVDVSGDATSAVRKPGFYNRK